MTTRAAGRARRPRPRGVATAPTASTATRETLMASTTVWPLAVGANGAVAAPAQHGVVLPSGEVVDFAALLDRALRAAGSERGLMRHVWLTSWRARMTPDRDPAGGA